MSVPLGDLASYLDEFLAVARIPDKSLNGLQVEGPAEVERVAVATDAALQTFELARRGGAQLLIVHHGLFWGDRQAAVTGSLHRRLQALLEGGLGLYCAHLPLDAHPEVGNNVRLARRLELDGLRPFGWLDPGGRGANGVAVGCGGSLPRALAREDVAAYCEERLDAPVRALAFGRGEVRTLAVVSGAAADLVAQAAREGYDAFLTGETSHNAYHPAREAEMNLLFAGHYATETWGVRALGEHLTERFGVESFFVDAPTGF
jgi:dinuclear metal center YbgI/SA1388 family protein